MAHSDQKGQKGEHAVGVIQGMSQVRKAGPGPGDPVERGASEGSEGGPRD